MAFNTRKTTADILYNVLKNKHTLSSELAVLRKNINISELDRRFVSEITNGVLRNLEYIDYIIKQSSDIKINKISPYVLSVLRCGVYQLVYMDKVPVSAAVNECVKIIKKSSNHRLAGFVNAVLRKASLIKDAISLPEGKLEHLSVKYSCPLWIVKKICDEIPDAEAFLSAVNQKTNTVLRVNKTLTTTDRLLKSLNGSGWNCQKYNSHLFPGIDYLITADKIENLEECADFKHGHFYVQDTAAAYAAQVLNPKPGSVVFDMCASPGGKTTHIAELMMNQGTVYAFDVNQDKIDKINENAARLNLTNIKASVMDSSVFDEKYSETADYLLVDSPCSGMGIIRKKPDIKYLRRKEDITELRNISLRILKASSRYLKPGGTMVFSTCTIFKDENEDVLFEFLKTTPGFRLKKIPCEKPNDGYMTLYPHTDDCDGFFISLIEKEK